MTTRTASDLYIIVRRKRPTVARLHHQHHQLQTAFERLCAHSVRRLEADAQDACDAVDINPSVAPAAETRTKSRLVRPRDRSRQSERRQMGLKRPIRHRRFVHPGRRMQCWSRAARALMRRPPADRQCRCDARAASAISTHACSIAEDDVHVAVAVHHEKTVLIDHRDPEIAEASK